MQEAGDGLRMPLAEHEHPAPLEDHVGGQVHIALRHRARERLQSGDLRGNQVGQIVAVLDLGDGAAHPGRGILVVQHLALQLCAQIGKAAVPQLLRQARDRRLMNAGALRQLRAGQKGSLRPVLEHRRDQLLIRLGQPFRLCLYAIDECHGALQVSLHDTSFKQI
ncbi:hypothetical protein D3C87_1648530 [compost metagenome]